MPCAHHLYANRRSHIDRVSVTRVTLEILDCSERDNEI